VDNFHSETTTVELVPLLGNDGQDDHPPASDGPKSSLSASLKTSSQAHPRSWKSKKILGLYDTDLQIQHQMNLRQSSCQHESGPPRCHLKWQSEGGAARERQLHEGSSFGRCEDLIGCASNETSSIPKLQLCTRSCSHDHLLHIWVLSDTTVLSSTTWDKRRIMTQEYPAVLTVAGSDSSGGAGIQVRICATYCWSTHGSLITGRPQNVHGSRMLRCERGHCPYCSKHRWCASSACSASRLCKAAGV
jgi:hypothetical protein